MQNQKNLQQMIREYELNMPPEIMDLIKSFDWRKEVRMIVNQNQLMLDIGADLEESVYLMILGVVQIEEVFERLIEVHNLPQDKVQKILTEVEKQVFEPMHHKLTDLEKDDTSTPASSVSSSTPPAFSISSTPVATPTKEVTFDSISRDEILGEIEKDAEPILPKPTTPVVEITPASTPKPFEIPTASTGAREPFSFASQKSTPSGMPIITSIGEDTMQDPVGSALTKPIVAQTEVSESKPTPPVKNYAVDPYREPIE